MTTTPLSILRTLLQTGTLLAALAAPALASAQLACKTWNLDQPWSAVQSNKMQAAFALTQRGTQLSGTGAYATPTRTSFPAKFGAAFEGRVIGTVRGDRIDLQADWGGVYTGTIDATGRIDGSTFDRRDSTSSATWHSDRRLVCLERGLVSGASNDFNGDQRGDILWHNGATGEAQVWQMNGAARIGRATLTDGARPVHIGPPWQLVGSRDFNGDQKSDLLWYNTSTGEVQLWFMQGPVVDSQAPVVDEAGRAVRIGTWSIVATSDLNGDGKTDILWHHPSSGELQAWLMNGPRIVRRAPLLAEDGSVLKLHAPRRVVSSHDVDGDGKPDLVLHNRVTGTTQLFLLDGLRVLSRPTVMAEAGQGIAVGLPWRITGSNDFNGDGKADLLWHNAASGESQVWFMEGARILHRTSVSAARDGGGALVGLPWRIVSQ